MRPLRVLANAVQVAFSRDKASTIATDEIPTRTAASSPAQFPNHSSLFDLTTTNDPWTMSGTDPDVGETTMATPPGCSQGRCSSPLATNDVTGA